MRLSREVALKKTQYYFEFFLFVRDGFLELNKLR